MRKQTEPENLARPGGMPYYVPLTEPGKGDGDDPNKKQGEKEPAKAQEPEK